MEQPSGQAKFLKQTREKRGISLQAIHEGTKIPLDVLKAIEEGYKIRTLSPFYYRGFLKMYAQYLGVDVSQIPEDLKSEHPAETATDFTASRTFQKKYKSAFPVQKEKLLILAGGAALVIFLLSQLVVFIVKRIPFKKSDSVKVASNIREQAKKVKKAPAVAPAPSQRTVTPVQAVPPSAQAVIKLVEPATSVPATPQVSGESAMAQTPPEKPKKRIKLTVKAKKNTWLQVQQDGNIVFQSTLKKGEAESWAANDSIEISGRSISQLEFELNGKMLAPLGAQDRSASKVVITKDGLSVKK